MNLTLFARRACGAAALIFLAGCAESDDSITYNLPIAEVEAKLLKTPLAPVVFGTQPPAHQKYHAQGKSVEWRLSSSGASKTRMVAELTPMSDGKTKIKVTIPEPTQAQLAERGVQRPDALIEMYRVSMREQIDARLNNRLFDMSVPTPYLQIAAQANMSTLMGDVERSGRAEAQTSRANILKAYEEERTGARTLRYNRDQP
jgi:hypothetical protein